MRPGPDRARPACGERSPTIPPTRRSYEGDRFRWEVVARGRGSGGRAGEARSRFCHERSVSQPRPRALHARRHDQGEHCRPQGRRHALLEVLLEYNEGRGRLLAIAPASRPTPTVVWRRGCHSTLKSPPPKTRFRTTLFVSSTGKSMSSDESATKPTSAAASRSSPCTAFSGVVYRPKARQRRPSPSEQTAIRPAGPSPGRASSHLAPGLVADPSRSRPREARSRRSG